MDKQDFDINYELIQIHNYMNQYKTNVEYIKKYAAYTTIPYDIIDELFEKKNNTVINANTENLSKYRNNIVDIYKKNKKIESSLNKMLKLLNMHILNKEVISSQSLSKLHDKINEIEVELNKNNENINIYKSSIKNI